MDFLLKNENSKQQVEQGKQEKLPAADEINSLDNKKLNSAEKKPNSGVSSKNKTNSRGTTLKKDAISERDLKSASPIKNTISSDAPSSGNSNQKVELVQPSSSELQSDISAAVRPALELNSSVEKLNSNESGTPTAITIEENSITAATTLGVNSTVVKLSSNESGTPTTIEENLNTAATTLGVNSTVVKLSSNESVTSTETTLVDNSNKMDSSSVKHTANETKRINTSSSQDASLLIEQHLNALKNKIHDAAFNHTEQAKGVLLKLVSSIEASRNSYLKNLKAAMKKSEANQKFLAQSSAAINQAKNDLKYEPYWVDYLTNFLKAIANAFIKMVSSNPNHLFYCKKPISVKEQDKCNAEIHELNTDLHLAFNS